MLLFINFIPWCVGVFIVPGVLHQIIPNEIYSYEVKYMPILTWVDHLPFCQRNIKQYSKLNRIQYIGHKTDQSSKHMSMQNAMRCALLLVYCIYMHLSSCKSGYFFFFLPYICYPLHVHGSKPINLELRNVQSSFKTTHFHFLIGISAWTVHINIVLSYTSSQYCIRTTVLLFYWMTEISL